MKQIIKGVLDDMSESQINLASSAARETVSSLISVALKTKGCYTEYDDSEIEEQNARATWVCSICGENTADVDYDYIGSGTNHLQCELKLELEEEVIGGRVEFEEPETRVTLYYPERVEKYVARGGVWGQYQVEMDAVWPLPWVDQSGQPLGIPFVHFRNRPMGEDFGTSEILNVVPMQDLINKTLIDLTMILDTLAFPQRYTLNIDHGSSRLDIMPGSVAEFHSEYEGGSVGQWTAASVDGPLRSLESLVQHVAGTTRTPQHLFQIMGGTPSGEALNTAESGLVNKAKAAMVSFGNAWEDCLIYALKVQGAFGTSIQDTSDAILQTTWDDPETRNEQAHMEALKSKAELGVSKHQIWRELGYTQEQIEQMDEDALAEKVQDTNLGAEILRNFNAGEI